MIKNLRIIILLFLILSSSVVLSATSEKALQQSVIEDEVDDYSVLSIKSISEFSCDQPKEKGNEEGKICILKEPGKTKDRFLVKFIPKDRVLNDYAAAFILRKIIGDRAPKNHIVRLENGDIALASRFIEGFISYDDYYK